ncbi:MAG: DeoR/GlpR family DNA-binding transcription regulator [Micrococcales bacterium]|nr:DeoR/GlpR family DNA-binding transcription regulator [Micrococcales bacterium]
MDRHERLSALLQILAERGKIGVDQAVKELGASAATIRRDLTLLQEQNLAARTHGGAVATSVSYDLPLRFKTSRFASQKAAIGKLAAAMVRPGQVVALNGGTTTLEVGRCLATRPDLAGQVHTAPVTVVTNAVNVASELLVRPHLKVVVTGGVVRAKSFELFGPLASSVIEQLSLDLVFLGVDGLDPDFGASAHSDAEAKTNAELAQAAARRVVVADSSKMAVKAFARICPVGDLDAIITDQGIDPVVKRRFEDANVKVHLAA